MQTLKRLVVLASVSTLMAVVGCSSGTSYVCRYGVNYNAEREKRGIPTIQATWTVQDFGKYIDWFDPQADLMKPHRLGKRVFIGAKGLIESEEDHFYSGKSFYWGPDHEKLPQGITITYYYTREISGTPWDVYGNLDADHYIQRLSLQEADDLLVSWGLSRGGSKQ